MSATSTPRSTMGVYLMKGTGTSTLTYSKLVPIKSFPDLGGEPEALDVTTLDKNVKTTIPGMQNMDTFTFDCNYIHSDYADLKALEGTTQHFAIFFDSANQDTPTGVDGKFTFDGKLTCWVNGGGVNEAIGMTVSINCETSVTDATAS